MAAPLFLRVPPERDPAQRLVGVRSKRIVEFAARMISRDWKGLSPISFIHGQPLDGQHRLGAAALAVAFQRVEDANDRRRDDR